MLKLLYIFSVGLLINRVDDVSAQTSCVISPDLDMLTTRSPLGRDVELHCQCMDDNGIITGTRWFSDMTTIVPTDSSSRPYSTGTAPSRLIFTSPFTNSDTGIYTCSPDSTFPTIPPGDSITLNAAADPAGDVNCSIVSTNLPTVTTAGGVIANGTQNVILYCICMRVDSNVTVGQTFWFFNGAQITLTQDNGSGNPYSRDMVPSTLTIPSFVTPHDGNYSCTHHNNFNDVATLGDTITLTLPVPVDPPTNFMATMVRPRSIVVTWTPSVSPDVTGYFITYTTDASYISMNDRSGSMPVGNTTRGTISNLEEGTTYTITVQSNSNDGLSGKSNVVTITTQTIAPSSPPQSVMVTGVPRASLMVSWQPPPEIDHNGPITGYMIQYTRDDGSSNPMTMEGISGIVISGLAAFVNYSVIVAAVNSAGIGTFSDPVVVISGEDEPTAPRSLMVVDSTDTSVTLSWMPPNPSNGIITQYQVQYRRIDGSDTFADNEVNIMATDLTYTVIGLMIATVYRFRVRAFTVVGRGNASNSVDVFVGLPAPTNVRATLLAPRSLQVTWTPSSSPDVTGYLISYTTTASYTSGGSVMVNSNSATSGTLNNLEEGTTYTITVQATASNNIMSGNSNAATVTTYTTVPSSPPQSVMVTSVNPASLMVSWQPPPPVNHNGPITGHVIQYTRAGLSDMISVNVNSGTTQYIISGLAAYVNYSVTVAAMNVNGTGPYSNTEVGRSGEDRPSEPESLDIISVNSSSVILQWRPSLTPNGVIVLYSLKYNSTTPVVTNTSGDVLMYTVGGLSSENVYVFQVKAHTGAGEGPPSSIVVVIPPSPIIDITVPNESVTSSALTLSWMEINLTNSVLIHYTVFYSPVSGPYDRIMASNRRKRQSVHPREFALNFTGTIGTLMDLNGSVTYRIQVATVVMLNGQVVTGDRSTVTEITTSEGVPSAPRNLSYTNLTTNGITLTWSRPDPPNGLITQYNISSSVTNSQCEIFYNFAILPVTNGDGIMLSYTWIELIQGRYQFSVVASTSTGPGESASLMLSILPSNEASSDGGSEDDNGVIIALATLLAIAVIGLLISVVINVVVIVNHKQSRYDVDQSDVSVRYSDVKQSVSKDHTITEYANQYIKPSEPEYEAIDTKSNMKPNDDVKMDANPAYQATT